MPVPQSNAETYTPEEALETIQKHYSYRLTEWETQFIHNLQDNIDEYRAEFGREYLLTANQRRKLFEIFDTLDGE